MTKVFPLGSIKLLSSYLRFKLLCLLLVQFWNEWRKWNYGWKYGFVFFNQMERENEKQGGGEWKRTRERQRWNWITAIWACFMTVRPVWCDCTGLFGVQLSRGTPAPAVAPRGDLPWCGAWRNLWNVPFPFDSLFWTGSFQRVTRSYSQAPS